MANALKCFRVALIQMTIGKNKTENISRAVSLISDATKKGSTLIVLPECFNSPYGTKFFSEYAEEIPYGETSVALAQAARSNGVYLVGGSIPEKDGEKLYNTCTVWNPRGDLITKHRKVHLFDIDIPDGIRFKESEVLSAGQSLNTFSLGEYCKVGLGICYDLRFHEMASLYQKQGVDLLIYPGAFNMKTGPLHWELLLRSRAVDNQVYVIGACGARDENANYVAWGHSMLIDPWGQIITEAEHEEAVLIADIDLNVCTQIREQIPIIKQRRTDLYETVTTSQL